MRRAVCAVMLPPLHLTALSHSVDTTEFRQLKVMGLHLSPVALRPYEVSFISAHSPVMKYALDAHYMQTSHPVVRLG
jgi:hypothetical protein